MPICPFCNRITRDTYQCIKCGTFFCKECIDEHEFCPKCSGRDFKKARNVCEVHGTSFRRMMERKKAPEPDDDLFDDDDLLEEDGLLNGNGLLDDDDDLLDDDDDLVDDEPGDEENLNIRPATPPKDNKTGCRIWIILLIGFILWLIIGLLMSK